MKKGYIGAFLAIATLISATTTQAMVHRVYPGESIQAAIDAASSGDTILVEPGVYGVAQTDGTPTYGLRITTDNLRLIGKSNKGKGKGKGKENKVRLVAYGAQETGVYAAPAGCEYKDSECTETLEGFYIRGFSVEEFPVNGIQTRWVDGFEFVRNASVNNLNNGIYPTLSANGLVRNNESYGSLDTAMWVAGSENVRVMGNELYGSIIGFEITVSNNVVVKHNEIYDNRVGVGLFHPNAAGNPQLPVMEDWVIQNNDIYDNNNITVQAPPGTFQGLLPPGAGVLLLGVSDHVVSRNNVEGNDLLGIGVLGWCTATFGTDENCVDEPPQADPASRNNLIAQNRLRDNGDDPLPILPPTILALAADLTYFQDDAEAPSGTAGNCFEKNKPKNDLDIFSSEASGELPTDGC